MNDLFTMLLKVQEGEPINTIKHLNYVMQTCIESFLKDNDSDDDKQVVVISDDSDDQPIIS